MALKKSKAEKLGFVNKQITNSDIINAISDGKIKYVSSEYKEDGIYLKTVLEFDYAKQKIENIDKSKYEIVNENS